MRGTQVTDTFSRTSTSGWGTADTGQAWTGIGVGGSVVGTDFTVGSGFGQHSVPATNGYRFSYLAGFSQAFVDLSVIGSVNAIALGAPIELANFAVRATSTTSYYTFRTQIEPSQAVTAKIFNPGGTQLGSITVPGITYIANLQLRVRAQAVGRILRMKVWRAVDPEPAAWILSVTDATYTGAGFVGLRSGIAAGNTNTLPLTFLYSNFTSALLPDFPNDQLPLTVLAAFGANLSTDPSTWPWKNITNDVRAGTVTITPGRGDETGQASPAACNFQLNNDVKAYSAHNPAGPNYPYVRRNTPIWVLVDPATRFFGYANGWVPSWDTTGKLPIVSVSASGSLRRLTQGKTPLRSPLYRLLSMTNPLAYWPLEDGVDSTQAAPGLIGGTPLTVDTGIMDFIDKGPAGSAGAAQPTVTAENSLNGPIVGGSGTQWQVSVWARGLRTNTAAGGYFIALEVRTDNGKIYRLALQQQLGTQNAIIARYESEADANPSNYIGTAVTTLDGKWHLLQATLTQSGSDEIVSFWLDGTLVGTQTWIGLTVGKPVRVSSIGRFGGPTGAVSDNMKEIGVAHIALHNTVTLIDQYQAGLGYAGEPAITRLARLCAEEGVPLAVTGGDDATFEGFEATSFAVPITGTWSRDSTQAHAGAWSLKSAAIGNSASTDAVVTVPAGMTSMSVWYRVSSESGFDWFRILRDGVQEFQSSGEIGWTQRTVDVTSVSQVTFRYIKDSSTISGSDAAWIDDLTFTGASSTKMGPQGIAAFVPLLRECESADLGLLYDGFGPGLGYITRSARYNQAAALTLDMAAGQVAPPFAPADDDQRNRNLFKVDRKGGSSATYEDATGPLGTDPLTGIGTYDSSATVNVATDDVLPDYASWLVHQGTVEGFRYPNLNLDMGARPELIDDWVAARLNSRIDVLNVDSKATGHAAGTVSLLDEGYTETLGPKSWKVAANCSPERPWEVFVLDADRLDADPSSQLVAGINATATTFQVQTAAIAGALWTTSSAEWTAPKTLYLNVAGEQMKVTNITGASSPQTFTVIRSINGVVKTQATGARVGLWQPRVLAL